MGAKWGLNGGRVNALRSVTFGSLAKFGRFVKQAGGQAAAWGQPKGAQPLRFKGLRGCWGGNPKTVTLFAVVCAHCGGVGGAAQAPAAGAPPPQGGHPAGGTCAVHPPPSSFRTRQRNFWVAAPAPPKTFVVRPLGLSPRRCLPPRLPCAQGVAPLRSWLPPWGGGGMSLVLRLCLAVLGGFSRPARSCSTELDLSKMCAASVPRFPLWLRVRAVSGC